MSSGRCDVEKFVFVNLDCMHSVMKESKFVFAGSSGFLQRPKNFLHFGMPLIKNSGRDSRSPSYSVKGGASMFEKDMQRLDRQ